jgi:hypothetical protein
VTEQTPPPPDSTGWRRYYTRTRAIAAGATAAILATFALLNGTLDLVDRVKGDTPTCADDHDITLEKPRLSRLVTRGQQLELDGASTAGMTKERLGQPGKRVLVHVKATGYKNEPLEIHAWLLTGDGAPVKGTESSNQLLREWTPGGCNDGTDAATWYPLPEQPGDYAIQVRVTEKGSREVLRSEDSDPFPVGAPATS